MPRGLAFVAAMMFAVPAAATQLVSLPEEALARDCLTRTGPAARIVDACDGALARAGLTPAQRVELSIALGDGQLWLGQPRRAISSYRAALKLDPRAVEAWNGIGWALWDIDGDAAALGAFEHSLSIGISVQALGGKAGAARRLGRIDNETARAMLATALSLDPDDIWTEREIGWSHLDDGQPGLARERFEAVLAVEPRDGNARYGLGRAQLASGKLEAALASFTAVLVEEPRDYAAQVYRTVTLRHLGRHGQALRAANRLIETYPRQSTGHIERGRALTALERPAEAIETFERADRQLGPNNGILYWYADALTGAGRLAEALAAIDRGLALEGADYTDHLLKAYIALELGRYDLARASAEASLATGVEDPWAHYYIAVTLVHGGRVAEALARFDRAIQAGLPADRVSAFASELIGAGRPLEAAELGLKY